MTRWVACRGSATGPADQSITAGRLELTAAENSRFHAPNLVVRRSNDLNVEAGQDVGVMPVQGIVRAVHTFEKPTTDH